MPLFDIEHPSRWACLVRESASFHTEEHSAVTSRKGFRQEGTEAKGSTTVAPLSAYGVVQTDQILAGALFPRSEIHPRHSTGPLETNIRNELLTLDSSAFTSTTHA